MPRQLADVLAPEEFDRLVAEALDAIPPEFARHLENVAVVVEDEPSPALLRRLGLDPQRGTLFGLYEGVPLPRRPHDFAGALPDHITIFRGPLLRGVRTRAELAREVQATVIHELAHLFGLDDGRIRRLGY
ncbi:MAG TPA: metallopeptidase family protein [Candidatus Binatia bacterium]|nr:metallopeptidase family protein [Candidatus Binatia bacterium]